MKVAWISDFGVEWLTELPQELRSLPRHHPLTWQRVLLSELEHNPEVELHICLLRKGIHRNISFELSGVHFHVLKVPAYWRSPSLFWVDTFLLKRTLGTIRPDVVHAWGTEKGASLVASRLHYPYLVTIQGLLQWYGELLPLTLYERLTMCLERVSLKRASVVTTESAFSAAYLKGRYPRIRVHQIEHAPATVFHQLRRKPQQSPLRLLSIATLGFRKGTDLLLRALDSLLPKVSFELILVGGGSDHPYLAPLRRTLSGQLWERIRFKPELQPADVAEELALATLLVLPTRADTSPNAVKEAVAAGVPVIASSIGGIPDYVFPDLNGLLFPSGDLHGLTESIRVACRHPLFSRGLVNPETLQRTRSYLSPRRMGEQFAAVYRACAQAAAGVCR